MNKTQILGTGSYVPEKILTNQDLAKKMETTDEWIISRTGIKERRVLEEDKSCSDMAYEASVRALKDAKISALDLDMIIVATLTADQRCPGASFLLQDKLGAKRAAVYDIAVACSGFVFWLSFSDQFF